MPRTVRALLADLFALTFGFAVASLSMTVLMAARSSDPLRTTAPAASVLSPSQGQIVSGNVIVAATASLDTDALQFQLSGANLGPAITSGACSVNWNTAAVNDGTYALTVLAFDAGGNMTPSGSVAVTVANNAPQITNVVMSNPTSTSVVITWTTNQVSTSRVDYGVNSLTSSLPVNWNLVTQHSATLTGLSPGTSYRFRATSSNGVGLSATSAVFTFATAAGDPATSDPDAVDATQERPLAARQLASPAASGAAEPTDRLRLWHRAHLHRLHPGHHPRPHDRQRGCGSGARRARGCHRVPRTRGEKCGRQPHRLGWQVPIHRTCSLDITSVWAWLSGPRIVVLDVTIR